MFTYELDGKDISLHFGMLFMPHYWALIDVPDFTGYDIIATCVFFGNRVFHKLNGGKPAFASISEVYKAMESSPDAEIWNQSVADFQSTKEYTSLLEAVTTVEDSKKK